MTQIRHCNFCFYSAPYEDFPNGSVCFVGVMACADCLKEERTREFRELIEEEKQVEVIADVS
jgi:superfamily II helicase